MVNTAKATGSTVGGEQEEAPKSDRSLQTPPSASISNIHIHDGVDGPHIPMDFVQTHDDKVGRTLKSFRSICHTCGMISRPSKCCTLS